MDLQKIKSFLKFTIYSGIFLAPFLPFIVSNSLFFPFITAKGFVFRIIVEIIFAGWILLALYDSSYRPRRSPMLIAISIFVFVIGLADLVGINPVKSFWSNFERMEGWILLAHLFAYFLVLTNTFKTEKVWNYFWNTTLGASLIVSFTGFLQLGGLVNINQGNVRLDAYIGNSAYLAVYLLFHIFIGIFLFNRKAGGETWRWFYVLTIILNTIILYYTATRGAILGLIGGLFISAILIALFEKERKIVRKIAIGIVAGVLVCIGLFFALKDTSFITQNQVLERFDPQSLIDTADTRISIWKIAIEGFKERPILGWGQENFNYVFNKYYDPYLFTQEQWFDRTHNIIFDWLVAGGILGLLSYLSIILILIITIFKIKQFSFVDKAILFGLISAYFLQNLFVFDNLLSYFMFFSLLAYINNKESENLHLEDNSNKQQVKEAPYISMISVGFVLVVVLYVVSIRPIFVNTTLISSFLAIQEGKIDESLVLMKKAIAFNSPLGNIEVREQVGQAGLEIGKNQKASDSIKEQFFLLGRQVLENQIKDTPDDMRHYVMLGSYFNSFGLYDEAINILEKAKILSPKKQIVYFELATSYVNKKDYTKAFEFFKQAHDFAPEFESIKILYALGSIYVNNQNLTDEILSKIDRKTIVMDNRFIQAYQAVRNFNEIIKLLKERVMFDSTNYATHLSLAATYMEINQKSNAIKELEEVVRLAPNEEMKAQANFYISEIKAGRNP